MATPSVRTLVRLLGPRVPLIVKTGIGNTLSLSETSSKWDLKTELIVTTLRSIIAESKSTISRQQDVSIAEPEVKANEWISKSSFPVPLDEQDEVRQLLFRVIDDLKESPADIYTKPELAPVGLEWQGVRSSTSAQPTGMSEQDKYAALMKETSSDLTVLYFHGGAYFTMDPFTYRRLAVQLAKNTKGRVCNVRYRLAPQHPFPAGLLDCLIAYLSLLYPPPDAFHSAVKPENIVFAGDSAGGGMCVALLLLLLQAQRTSTTVAFNGKQVSLPLPAGIATNSVWSDVSQSLPSHLTNKKYDYLPPTYTAAPPGVDARTLSVETHPPPAHSDREFPPCAIWPATPARAHLYADASMLLHPLVSPLAAPKELFEGAPPMYFLLGEEKLADEVRVVARECARAGVSVVVDAYEAMPHVFNALIPKHKAGELAERRWAAWMSDVVENPDKGIHKENKFTWIQAKSLNEVAIADAEALTSLTREEVDLRMRYARQLRVMVFDREQAKLKERGEKL